LPEKQPKQKPPGTGPPTGPDAEHRASEAWLAGSLVAVSLGGDWTPAQPERIKTRRRTHHIGHLPRVGMVAPGTIQGKSNELGAKIGSCRL